MIQKLTFLYNFNFCLLIKEINVGVVINLHEQ